MKSLPLSFCVQRLFRLLSICIFSSVIISCGGGSEEGSLIPTPTVRIDNPDIPVEFSGQTSKNTRFYASNTAGYQISVLTSGLSGSVILKLGDELLTVDDNTNIIFDTTFVANTVVSVFVESQPFLQECAFAVDINTGTIRSDSTLQLELNCVNSNKPAAPHIAQIYSTTIDSINLDWEAAADLDSASNEISYKIYWSTIQADVEDKSAEFEPVAAGMLSALLNNLQTNTTYYIAIEATDLDGNVSDLSGTRSLKTISKPNVLTGAPFHNLDTTDIASVGSTWTIPINSFSTAPQVGDVLTRDLGNNLEIVKVVAISSVSSNYVIEVEAGGLADVFEQLTLSSDIGVNIQATGNPQSLSKISNNGYAQKTSLSTLKASVCRSGEAELTEEELAQITISLSRSFKPRFNTNFDVDLTNPFNPQLIGEAKFSGKIEVKMETSFEVSSKLRGKFTCELTGLPLVFDFKYLVAGVPVYQDLSIDAKLQLTFDSEINFNGKVSATAFAKLDAKLFRNSTDDQWAVAPLEPAVGYKVDNALSYAAKYSGRASIIPAVSTSLYKVATISLSFDSGMDARMDAEFLSNDSNDPFSIFRDPGLPFILEEFSVHADILFKLAADLTLPIIGTLLDYPENTIYKTQPLRIFDTPDVCVNAGADKDNCETFTKITPQSSGNKRYELEVHLLDGTNNPYKLSSIQWQVSPENGHIEVGKNDPRKVTFEAFDDEAYTIVASVHGVLGEPARKYAQFSLSGDCAYGLGHKLPAGTEQYFEESDKGYIFPRDLNVVDPENDFHEVCGTTQYYAGQRNGRDIQVSENVPIERFYENGMVVSVSFTSAIADATYKYTVIPDPESEFNISVLRYNKVIYTNDPFVQDGIIEVIYNLDSMTFERKDYSPDGTLIYYSRALLDGSNLDIRQDNRTAVYHDGDPIYQEYYYSNGDLMHSSDLVTFEGVNCGWRIPIDNVSYSFLDLEGDEFADTPGYVYECR